MGLPGVSCIACESAQLLKFGLMGPKLSFKFASSHIDTWDSCTSLSQPRVHIYASTSRSFHIILGKSKPGGGAVIVIPPPRTLPGSQISRSGKHKTKKKRFFPFHASDLQRGYYYRILSFMSMRWYNFLWSNVYLDVRPSKRMIELSKSSGHFLVLPGITVTSEINLLLLLNEWTCVVFFFNKAVNFFINVSYLQVFIISSSNAARTSFFFQVHEERFLLLRSPADTLSSAILEVFWN